jgi:GntR family transcriptional repressor for pyruvate dehydrogenase complex
MVAEAIVELITEKGLQPGDRIPTEKGLSEQLGIGKTSLREGIRQLEAVGLLSSQQGGGVFVRTVTIDSIFKIDRKIPLARFLKLNKQEILDLVYTRLLIETATCRLATERITEEQITNLRILCNAMANSIDDPERFIVYDVQFHEQILFASGNVILGGIFKLIEDIFSKQQAIVAALPGELEKALKYHRRILSALARRNPDLAVKSLEEHVNHIKEVLDKNL